MLQHVTSVLANPDAKRLYDDLLRRSGYNKHIRPVRNLTDKLIVSLGLRLSQLIDLVSVHSLGCYGNVQTVVMETDSIGTVVARLTVVMVTDLSMLVAFIVLSRVVV